MAENPTSSSTMYTTLGAPSGALGGSNGAQSGTESLMSTLMVPRNGLPIALFPRSAISVVPRPEPGARVHPGRPGSAEQFGLCGRELLVAQRALLVQFGELVELVEHGWPCRSGLLRWRLLVLRLLVLLWWGLLVLLLLVLLLLEVRDPLVLIGLRLRRLFPPPARAPADRVRGPADRGCAQQRASSPYHDLPPS